MSTAQSLEAWTSLESAHEPRLVFRSRRVAVYDDFLPSREVDALYDVAKRVDYEVVHRERVQKVWRPHDGLPLRGAGAQLTVDGLAFVPGEDAPGRRFEADAFFRRMMALSTEIEPLVGARGKDWMRASAAPWVYPAGSALSLHYDGGEYSGAYTYYLHRTWNLHWGGLLLVIDHDDERSDPRAQARDGTPATAPWIDETEDTALLMERGLGLAIFPKPNRIVFLAGGTPHMVTRVDPNAGQHVRLAVSGFFQRPRPEPPLTLGTRIARTSGVGGLSVRVRDGAAELVRDGTSEADVIARVDEWGAEALRVLASRRELAVRDLPAPLHDDDRLALCQSLVRAKIFAPCAS